MRENAAMSKIVLFFIPIFLLVYINTENFDKIEKIAESCVIYV
jgi:hypothetical protein